MSYKFWYRMTSLAKPIHAIGLYLQSPCKYCFNKWETAANQYWIDHPEELVEFEKDLVALVDWKL